MSSPITGKTLELQRPNVTWTALGALAGATLQFLVFILPLSARAGALEARVTSVERSGSSVSQQLTDIQRSLGRIEGKLGQKR